MSHSTRLAGRIWLTLPCHHSPAHVVDQPPIGGRRDGLLRGARVPHRRTSALDQLLEQGWQNLHLTKVSSLFKEYLKVWSLLYFEDELEELYCSVMQ